MSSRASFGRWLSARRHLLGLSQQQLAQLAHCSVPTIRKVEADERRLSLEIAERLADSLHIAATEREAFLASARGGLLLEEPEAIERSIAPLPRESGRTNLVVPLTPLIGRAQDVAAVRNRLLQQDERLLTLIGPPGIGKTRLSIAVAVELRAAFPDGVFFVALAPIHDPNLVLSTLAQTLGLSDYGSTSSAVRVTQAMHDKRMLLVLDNFEQVLAAASTIVELLQACPAVKIVVTSRTALRVRGERLYPVPPLLLPDLARLPFAADLVHVPTIELFLDRAQAIVPDFRLTTANAPAIAAICARLDGLPLAIELVVARVRLLPPAALLARLDSRLTLLTDGPRDLPPRHRTLRGAIAWSHELLTDAEQTIFRRLGIFVGGWEVEAAEAVIGADWSSVDSDTANPTILDGLQSLLDKSLLFQVMAGDEEPRFTMLETIREYALEQLSLSGETAAVRLSHAAYYVTLVEAVEPERLRFHSVAQQELLEREYANIREVFTSLTRDSQAERELLARLAGALLSFWNARGYTEEARRWILKVLTFSDDSTPAVVRLKVAHAMTWIMAQCEDWTTVATYAQACLKLAVELGDARATGVAMHYLADVAMHEGRYHEAETLLQETRVVARGSDDLVEAYALNRLGKLAESKAEYAQARRWFEDALRLVRELNIPLFAGMMLSNLGRIARIVGDDMEALMLHREGMCLTWEQGWQRSIPESLEAIASLTAGEWATARTVSTISAAHGLRERLGMPDAVGDAPLLAVAKADLGEIAFATAWTAGREMPIEQAVAGALASVAPSPASSACSSTRRRRSRG